MKVIKKLLLVIVVILLIVVVLVGVGLFYSDSLIKVGVETAGTQATGTATTLDKAHLAITKGELSLGGLKLTNPPGYQTDHLLNIGQCTTAVNINSLMSDTIEVTVIRLENLSMTLEQRGLTSNLSDILNQMKKKEGATEKAPQPAEKKPGKPGKKIKVDLIEIKDTVVRIKLLPIPGKSDVAEIKLGTITLHNVGSDGNKPEMISTIFQKVLVALSEAIVKAGGSVLPADLQKGLAGSADAAKQLVGGVTSQVTEQTGKVLKEGGKAVENILKAPGQLLKSPAKKEETQGTK